jgi:hypothetical protein
VSGTGETVYYFKDVVKKAFKRTLVVKSASVVATSTGKLAAGEWLSFLQKDTFALYAQQDSNGTP